MTLNQLIEMLKEAQEQLGESSDCEVRLAVQPSWPLACYVDEVTLEPSSTEKGREGPVVWIAAGSGVGYDEHPYAPKQAWDGGNADFEQDNDRDEE